MVRAADHPIPAQAMVHTRLRDHVYHIWSTLRRRVSVQRLEANLQLTAGSNIITSRRNFPEHVVTSNQVDIARIHFDPNTARNTIYSTRKDLANAYSSNGIYSAAGFRCGFHGERYFGCAKKC